MATLEYVETWSDYPQAGGVRTGFLCAPAEATDVVDLDDGTDEARAAWPKSHPRLALLAYGAVLAFCFSDGTKAEREIVERQVASGAGDGLYRVRLVGPQERLRRLPMTQTDGDGFVFAEVPIADLTPSTVVSQHLLAAPAPTWIIAGTINPTDRVDLQFSEDTRWSAARKLADVAGVDVWLERFSSSQFKLHLGTRGGSAPTLRIRTGKNLLALERSELGDPVTMVQGVGADADEGKASLAFAFWSVGGVSGNDVTLAPLHGAGPGPIGFANQGTDYRTPNLVANPDPSAATPVGTVVITRDYLTGGGYTFHDIRDDASGAIEYLAWAVGTIPAGRTVLGCGWVVRKGITHVAPDYLQVYDSSAAALRLSLEVTWDGGGVPAVVAGTGTFVDAIDLGDGAYFIRGLATGVVAANTHETRLIPGGAAAANLARIGYADHVVAAQSTAPTRREPWYLEKADGTVTMVVATDETTQEVTVGYVTGITAGDRVRFVANGVKQHLTMLELPERATLGDRIGRYESAWDDSEGYPANNTFVTYTNPSARPDGYGGAAGTASKVTSANNHLTAGQSCQLVVVTGPGSPVVILERSADVATRIRKRRHQISATCWFRITALSNGQIGMRLTRAGSQVGEVATWRSPINVWRQFKIDGLDLSAYIDTTQQLNLELLAIPDDGATMSATVLVDSLLWTPAKTARPIAQGSGAARIWQQANEWGAATRGVPVQYRIAAADLERAGIPRTAAVEPGGSLLADDDELGVYNVSARIRRRDRDLLRALLTSLGVASSPPRLRSQLATYDPPRIPFFEAVAVQAATRDQRQAAQILKAEITATSGSTVTITLTHSDLLNGTPVISYAAAGASYGSGSGLGPYVFNRPAAGSGVGRVVFTSKIPGRSDATDAVDVPEVDYLDVGNIVPFFASDAGSVSARLEGSGPTLSWRYAVSTSAMPADATVDAASPTNGRSLDLTALATLDFGQTLYLKAKAYNTAGGTGIGSAYMTATFRRDNKVVTKTLRIPFAEFNPRNNTTTWIYNSASYVQPNSTGTDEFFIASIPLPKGVTIKAARWRWYRADANQQIDMYLYKAVDTTETTLTSELGPTGTGWNTTTKTGLSQLVGDEIYTSLIRLRADTLANLVRLHYLEIDYDAPTLVTTV